MLISLYDFNSVFCTDWKSVPTVYKTHCYNNVYVAFLSQTGG